MMTLTRTFAILMLALLAVVACSEKPVAIAPPSNLIERDTFVTVLTEVRLLEGAYSASYERVDTSKFPITAHYNRLFDSHHITKEQYLSSYDYYSLQPDEMLEIEADVSLRLEQLKWSRDTTQSVSR